MTIAFTKLKGCPRILIEAALKPVAGTRIQPTGFPDLGPAVYDAPDGTQMLLVESAQSMANRLEAVCWDEAKDNLVEELEGMPFVRVKLAGLGKGTDTTNSLLEFHRLNSPYIMFGVINGEMRINPEENEVATKVPAGSSFAAVLTAQLGLGETKSKDKPQDEEGEGIDVAGVVDLRKLARICFRYDPNSLVHGIFLAQIAGRLRHPRALSSFIEAAGVGRADSGGVKFDRALPKPKIAGVDAKGGYGNVPFHRTEFTAKAIKAFFSLDLAQLRGYGLPDEATQFLVVLSLWKVRKFLESSMRLRSACELELTEGEKSIIVTRPDQFPLPATADLEGQLRALIPKCKSYFADPAETVLTWTSKK